MKNTINLADDTFCSRLRYISVEDVNVIKIRDSRFKILFSNVNIYMFLVTNIDSRKTRDVSETFMPPWEPIC